MEEVFTSKYKITENGLYARVSQCVAVGILSENKGLAHIHCNTNLNMLEEFLDKAFCGGTISVCGGADAFVPYLGFIPGNKNADRILETISKHGLEKYIKEVDVYADKVREMYVLGDKIRIYQKNYK